MTKSHEVPAASVATDYRTMFLKRNERKRTQILSSGQHQPGLREFVDVGTAAGGTDEVLLPGVAIGLLVDETGDQRRRRDDVEYRDHTDPNHEPAVWLGS